MEPLSIQSTAASSQVRPVGLQPDVTSLLQHGRVLAGQVLERFGGGSILLGVGRHRVPAESQVELPVGERLLFQVEGRGSQLVLHVLGAGTAEPELVRALRAAVGEDRPVARLLGDLAARLRAQAQAGGQDAPRAGRLLQQLASHVFQPGSDGADLGTLLARSGLRYEAALAGASSGSDAPANVTPRGLASLWAQSWAAGSDANGPELRADLAQVFTRALGEALGSGEGAPGAGGAADRLAEVVGRLREALGRAARGLPRGAAREALEAGLRTLEASALAGKPEGGLLARLLGLDAGVDVRTLAQWSARAALAELEHDLKALLLRARGALGEGPIAEALTRALTGLEAEQLLNLARRESHDAWHWSFPVPDGDAWRTAHLFYRHGREGGGGEEGGAADTTHRFVLGVELSRVGPVRAELMLRADLLGVRVTVTRPDVAERMRGDLLELRDRIAASDRRVHVSIVEGTPAEASVDPLLTDIRYLREHPLLDLSG